MPVTKFVVEEKYAYLEGFGNYHQSEAFPGANTVAINSPQKPPLGLLTERISGSSFTAPRYQNLQTFLYRTVSSLGHSEYVPYGADEPSNGLYTPNSYLWPSFPVSEDDDWTSQRLLSSTGDAVTKTGLAIRLFAISKDMTPNTVFSSLDGDMLVIPQAGGCLDIQTELGHLLVRPNEIAVIPRGIRHRVTLPSGPSRGYVCELYQGHFRLPELGPIGSCSLANQRDFQIPVASYDGELRGDVAVPNSGAEWTIIARLTSRLWSCTQNHTPFDVAAWHGTFYPYKYDLGRFSVLGGILYDHPDPSIFTVLTAPSHREPGTAVVDFAIIPPRWNMMEDTYWPPYYHRNTMSEFSGPIVYDQDPGNKWNKEHGFKPYGAQLNSTMTVHGPSKEVHEKARASDLRPRKLGTEGLTIFLLETECPMKVEDWAVRLLTRPKL